MFRVLERATGLLVIAAPERTARPRRSAPAANGRIAIPIEPVAASPMLAPWGEPAEPFPWVVVTTQAWPDAWPGMGRANVARARAVEPPIDIVARPATPPPPAAFQTRTPPTLLVAHDPTPDPAPRQRGAARPRRGFVARVALLVIGLLVSLVVVEAATRANRR